MVLYTEISELFCTSFRLALVSKILLKTLSECESRIVGRSPNSYRVHIPLKPTSVCGIVVVGEGRGRGEIKGAC